MICGDSFRNTPHLFWTCNKIPHFFAQKNSSQVEKTNKKGGKRKRKEKRGDLLRSLLSFFFNNNADLVADPRESSLWSVRRRKRAKGRRERRERRMLPTASKGRTSSNVRPVPAFAHYLRRIIKVLFDFIHSNSCKGNHALASDHENEAAD